MKVLFAASELLPYVKTGGLADVADALPRALKKYMDISVVIPLYGFLEIESLQEFDRFELELGGILYSIEIYFTLQEGLSVYFIKAPLLSTTKHLYGYNDIDYANNDLRFGIFSAAIVELSLKLKIDLLHLNDWHTALAALFIDQRSLNIKTVFTIHNLAYQGIFSKESCERLGIDPSYFNMDALEFYGQLNSMKGGIAYSDAVTTVSPSYAQEILTDEFGCGLEGFLSYHDDKLSGILNGINTKVFDPANDPYLQECYNSTTLENKHENKVAFLKTSKLKDPRKTLFVVISRLVEQKGMELLIKVLPDMLEKKINVFVLGEGEELYTSKLNTLASKYSNFDFQNSYDEVLSHKVYAAADFFVMPSLFEPCGLAQMIAMRYGTIPIVHAIGGLKDSVHEEKNRCGRGIVFEKYTKKEFSKAIERALKLKRDSEAFKEAVVFNMECDFSFETGAKSYMKLYESLF
ncbi:glycogen synthase [Sulfurimonas sp. C5]|uniref:glycogen synthase n=1 Tax=Sulfurimonas sp. C5 TaxID=3036947 RepID=UPI002457521C|nr:glycogen synthase [Sulfurimonas sp. C5]MDH4944912.1 glycogen synthase [Sulfurimonas sp. C5]